MQGKALSGSGKGEPSAAAAAAAGKTSPQRQREPHRESTSDHHPAKARRGDPPAFIMPAGRLC